MTARPHRRAPVAGDPHAKHEGTRLLRFAVWLETAVRQLSPFTWHTGHRKVFFPGCSLTSGDPELVEKVHEFLRTEYADMGVWSACCGKPLHKFVGSKAGLRSDTKLGRFIRRRGITEIVTACGNCFSQFDGMTGSVPGLKVTSVYGLTGGALYASSGATLGAAMAFFVSQYLLRDTIRELLSRGEAGRNVLSVIENADWKLVLLTRLSPVFPYNALNYGYGLTKLPFWKDLIGSWLGMLPGTVLYVYLGSIAGGLASLSTGVSTGPRPAAWFLVQALVWPLRRRSLRRPAGRHPDVYTDISEPDRGNPRQSSRKRLLRWKYRLAMAFLNILVTRAKRHQVAI